MKEIQGFLEKFNNYYLNAKKYKVEKTPQLDSSDVVLYKINSVTYKKDSPRREALENVLSALRIEGINFIYLILGNSEGVEFYYGLSRDYTSKNELEIDIDEIGKYILEPSIKGNFRGSEIQKIEENTKRKILERIGSNKYYSIVEGVPGVLEKDDEFQGVDRLADVMSNSPEYGFMIVSSLVSDSELEIVKKNIFNIYTTLTEMGKESRQVSNGTNKGTNESKTDGSSTSDSLTETTGTSENKQEGKAEQKSVTQGTNTSSGSSSSSSGSNKGSTESTTTNSSITVGGSKSQAIGKTTGSNQSIAKGTSEGITYSQSVTTEIIDKQAQDWIKYIDDVLLTRLDYGSAKGMFRSGMFCFSNSKAILKKT